MWQRQVRHGSSPEGLQETWPDHAVFRSRGLAEISFPLIVADWKVARAAAKAEAGEPLLRSYRLMNGESLEIASEADAEMLDPPPPPERDWHATYAAELATRPEILADLNRDRRLGDGIEYILERAQLSAGERAVIRPFLYGTEIRIIAEDLKWRSQTVHTLLRNALDRLHWLGQNTGVGTTRGERGLLIQKGAGSNRARVAHVSGAAGPRQGAHA